MRKITCFTIALFCFIASAHSQNNFVRKVGVAPSFLTKHGAYFSIEDTQSELGVIYHSILFYNDGTFYIGGSSYDSRISMNKKLDEYNNPSRDVASLSNQDAWGSYYVSNDTIYMQRFSYSPGNDFSDKTTGMIGVINSDNSFNMIKETCDWCGINEYFGADGHIFGKPVAYNLYPLNRLPDPSLAWFRKKQWFTPGITDDQRTIATTVR